MANFRTLLSVSAIFKTFAMFNLVANVAYSGPAEAMKKRL